MAETNRKEEPDGSDELSIRTTGSSSFFRVDDHLAYRLDDVRFPSGKETRYAYIDDDYSAAAVIPVDRRRGRHSIFLVLQERYPSQSVGWEIVAGQPHEGESQFEAGQRELAEEAKLKAGLWQPLPQVFQLAGRGNTRSDTFLAADLSPAERPDEPNEVILDRRWFTMSEVEDLMLNGQISSGHTLAGLAMAGAFFDRHPGHPISVLTASTPEAQAQARPIAPPDQR